MEPHRLICRYSANRIVERALPALLVLVFAMAQAAPGGTKLSLQKDWQVTIGPLMPRFYLYRTAVCLDGTVYFTDRQGRLGLVGPDGTIVEDRVRPALVGASALACDEAGRPVIAVATPDGRHIIALESPRDGLAVRWKTGNVPEHIYALIARGGQVFALAPAASAPGDSGFLYSVSSDGAVQGPFGKPPQFVAADLAHQSLADGSLLWSAETQELSFLSSGSNELQSYALSGQLKRVSYRADPGFMPFALVEGPQFRAHDVLNSAVRLPSGEIVVFVTKISPQGPQAYLEILHVDGTRLVPDARRVSISEQGGFGFLFGADAAGALYFNRGLRDRREATIVKARLVSD